MGFCSEMVSILFQRYRISSKKARANSRYDGIKYSKPSRY